MIDISKARRNFPVVNNMIYLDHAAVAPIHLRIRKALDEYMDHFLNNGIRDYIIWADKTEKIRSEYARFLNASPEEIAFVKSTSAGISIFANGIDYKKGDNVVLPNIEFPANVYPWMNLQRQGVNVKFLKPKNGFIDLNDLDNLIDEHTRVVAISWVEYLNGFRNDLKAISSLCKEKSEKFGRKIYFCVDAIQGLGALKLDLNDVDIDFLAADGHKWLLSIEGAGILYCNKNILNEVHPVTVGWNTVKDPLDFTHIHFELDERAKKFEEGSMNLAGILSLGASLDLINEFGIENIEERILSLSSTAINLLQDKGVEIVSSLNPDNRSGIVSFKTQNLESDYTDLLNKNIQLSLRGGVMRISPHFYNTEEELEKFVSLIG